MSCIQSVNQEENLLAVVRGVCPHSQPKSILVWLDFWKIKAPLISFEGKADRKKKQITVE